MISDTIKMMDAVSMSDPWAVRREAGERRLMSAGRDMRVAQRARCLGVRPETLEEFFYTGIRLETGGAP